MVAVRGQHDGVLQAAGTQVPGLAGAQPLRRSSGSFSGAAACTRLLVGAFRSQLPRTDALHACCKAARMWECLLILRRWLRRRLRLWQRPLQQLRLWLLLGMCSDRPCSAERAGCGCCAAGGHGAIAEERLGSIHSRI